LEGGACGVAVVTTGYMGATPETAWIVRNKDIASIVQGIVEVVSDSKQRMRKRELFLRGIQRYSGSHVSDEMIKIIEREN
jgi:glycosyltransferase involved in cell wall biosynthesis